MALVPTMGALHRGHAALIEAARASTDRVIVSIFVNPTQFAPGEDFEAYPRTLDADREVARGAGADLIYAPTRSVMYPGAYATEISVGGPATAGLEDRFRPTHFAGVAAVVAKLLNQASPDLAVFGEKDFQQLRVIQQVTRDLDIPVRIEGVSTVREVDGLALSSRNIYLDRTERARAPILHAALVTCAQAIRRGAPVPTSCEAARATLTNAGFVVDYLEARRSDTLAVAEFLSDGGRLLSAARLGRTRLIDNVPIGP